MSDHLYEFGHRVKRRHPGAAKATPIGTIVQVYSEDWANITDEDVAVEWDGGGRTSERADDLEPA